MIVSNHLSYLDILAYSALTPCVFVAKDEVASWPVVGLFRTNGRHDFRQPRPANASGGDHGKSKARAERRTVVLFAEGTSSDGRTVLPFRPALLEPIVKTSGLATPAAIGYAITDGWVESDVCYWRDMTFLPHLLNLLDETRRDGPRGIRSGDHQHGLSERLRGTTARRRRELASSGLNPARRSRRGEWRRGRGAGREIAATRRPSCAPICRRAPPRWRSR